MEKRLSQIIGITYKILIQCGTQYDIPLSLLVVWLSKVYVTAAPVVFLKCISDIIVGLLCLIFDCGKALLLGNYNDLHLKLMKYILSLRCISMKEPFFFLII